MKDYMAKDLVGILKKTAIPLAGGLAVGFAGYYITGLVCEKYFGYAMAMSIGFEDFVKHELKPYVGVGLGAVASALLFLNSRRKN